jgi:hypothetical protein
VPTLWQLRQGLLPLANANLAYWVGRGGQLRTQHPALRGTQRERLARVDAGGRILACARWTEESTVPLLVLGSFERDGWTTGRFDVGSRARAWLQADPLQYLQVVDRLGADPDRMLWRRPLQAQQVLDEGLHVGLQPYQIQVLEFVPVS